jgi:hypothetical protein
MNGSQPGGSGGRSESLVAQQLAHWGITSHVVRDAFGTDDGDEIEHAIDKFCAESFGSAVVSHGFFDASVGSVHGVRLGLVAVLWRCGLPPGDVERYAQRSPSYLTRATSVGSLARGALRRPEIFARAA